MLVIRESTVDEMLTHAVPMFKAHRDEVAKNKDIMVLKPNADAYYKMESAGALLLLAAWKDDQMIGYSVNFIMPHHHYMDMVYCNNDLLFVDADHRHGRIGLKLIKETERIAKERGAHIVFWRAKPGTALEQILPKIGCEVQETVFYSRL